VEVPPRNTNNLVTLKGAPIFLVRAESLSATLENEAMTTLEIEATQTD
jgi:hypothetical protein